MKIRAVEAAKQEFAEAIAHHRGLSPILGERFERAVNRAIVEIIDHPTMHARISGDYRRCRVRKFQYGIVFEITPDEIVVIAFMYLGRQPDYWKGRT